MHKFVFTVTMHIGIDIHMHKCLFTLTIHTGIDIHMHKCVVTVTMHIGIDIFQLCYLNSRYAFLLRNFNSYFTNKISHVHDA